MYFDGISSVDFNGGLVRVHCYTLGAVDEKTQQHTIVPEESIIMAAQTMITLLGSLDSLANSMADQGILQRR